MKNSTSSFKSTITLFTSLLLFIGLTVQAQVNESPNAYFDWGKKKTEFQDGYVILKSGDKMEGKISLSGSPEQVSTIKLKTNDKTIKLSPKSVNAYGLYFAGLVNDSDKSLYKWRSGAEVMGHKLDGTKPMPGYVILGDDTKVSGTLKLKRRDGMINKVEVETNGKKQSFHANEVAHYGLLHSVASLTNNGKKEHNAPGQNFHSGMITLRNGDVRTGQVAFRSSKKISDSNLEGGYYYMNLYFVAYDKKFADYYSTEEIEFVMQTIDGEEVSYQSLGNSLIRIGAWDHLTFKDKSKELCPGTVTLRSGEKLVGKVARVNVVSFYCNNIVLRNEEGILTQYGYPELISFTQTQEDGEIAYVEADGVYVRNEFEGNSFLLYRNPFPTTENKFLTGLIDGVSSVGMAVAASEYSKKVAKKDGYEDAKLHEKISNASYGELEQMDREINQVLGSDNVPKEMKKTLAKQSIAIQMAKNSQRIGTEGNNVFKIMKKEWIIKNKNTEEEILLVASDYRKTMSPYLEGCASYLSMDKKQQRRYRDWDNVEQTIRLLDECY